MKIPLNVSRTINDISILIQEPSQELIELSLLLFVFAPLGKH